MLQAFTTPFFARTSVRALWLSALLLVGSGLASGQPPLRPGPAPLVLRAVPLAITPREFYVARVLDARSRPVAAAQLLVPSSTTPAGPLTTQQVDFQGGTLAAVQQFVQQSVPRNPALRPITLQLKECRLTETLLADGRVEGTIALAMSLDWTREGQPLHLTDYRGSARYVRPPQQPVAVEPLFQRALKGALLYVDAWMNQQAPHNDKLATGLTISFADYAGQAESDTVFYSPEHPLRWADFTAAPHSAGYAAAVFPSFSYAGRPEMVNGKLHVQLTFKVFVVRSSSWVAPGQQTAYNLNHEQRHFDLVKLIVERYKRRVPADSLTLADYNSQLQYQYIESYREMNRLQDQYDAETRHGTDAVAQERWNQRIDAELRATKAR